MPAFGWLESSFLLRESHLATPTNRARLTGSRTTILPTTSSPEAPPVKLYLATTTGQMAKQTSSAEITPYLMTERRATFTDQQIRPIAQTHLPCPSRRNTPPLAQILQSQRVRWAKLSPSRQRFRVLLSNPSLSHPKPLLPSSLILALSSQAQQDPDQRSQAARSHLGQAPSQLRPPRLPRHKAKPPRLRLPWVQEPQGSASSCSLFLDYNALSDTSCSNLRKLIRARIHICGKPWMFRSGSDTP